MKEKIGTLALTVLLGILTAFPVFGQAKAPQITRRPPAVADPAKARPTDDDGSVFILDGVPMLFDVHHDTEVGTGNPIDVDVLVIEMQIMNSDGDLEPVGLQIHNFFTHRAQDIKNDINRHNARDCRTWANLASRALRHRDPNSKTWPYIEMVTNRNARVVNTNEDGQVWYSDDVECWGSSDRFSPF